MLRMLALALLVLAAPAAAETLRVATYEAGLSRKGPGLLVHELENGPSEQALAAIALIRAARPDLLLLNGIDHDLQGRALDALRARLAEGPDGIDYRHAFTAPVNAGVPSGHDLDGDGRSMRPEDAFGWGRFPGQGGMAVLSRLPIDAAAVRSFLTLPWAALPGATLPERPGGAPFPDAATRGLLRLSSRAHWDVPVILPGGGRLHLLASQPTPPLFDGPERLNRLRNRDEVRFWSLYLGGTALTDDAGHSAAAPADPVVLAGDLNLDALDGAGERAAIAELLASPRLADPRPASAGAAAEAEAGVNGGHDGDPALDTADFDEAPGKSGNLRLDYLLPDARLAVAGAGVFWPAPGAALADEAATASRHRLVWVDLGLPGASAP